MLLASRFERHRIRCFEQTWTCDHRGHTQPRARRLSGRLEFSVIGDAVIVAARVEAAARRTGDVVLLAENVKRLLRANGVPLEERPAVPLKGKSEEIMLYAAGCGGADTEAMSIGAEQSDESGAELARLTWRRMIYRSGAPAVVGGVLVVVLFLVLLGGIQGAVVRNLVVAALYLAVAFPVAIHLRHRRYAPVERWLRAERPATDAERETVLRQPIESVINTGASWGIGAILFAALNLDQSIANAIAIGVTVVLGGATTCALIYLIAERVLRPVTARALEAGPAGHPVSPGVAGRLTMAWVLGTGVPALGVVSVATVKLAGGGLNENLVLGATLFLGVVVLGVGLAATLLASRSVAEPVTAMRGALARVENGDLEARVTVDDGSEVGLLQAGFNRMAEGLQERERIREALGTYVDRDVAEHILREGTSLAGEEVEVTMMFIDIRNFTGIAERSTAPEVVATINRLFERAVPVIHAHHGHVDKFVGDGLLAVFGAPRRQADHADQALAAALGIERAVAEEFAGELEIGVGLNSGTVVAGNVGGAGRLEFSVIGDAVNVAARVEAATRKTGDTVLISEHTRRLLSGAADGSLEERAAVPLKGKSEPVRLYAPAQQVPARSDLVSDSRAQ
jgi:adenylate cyclase